MNEYQCYLNFHHIFSVIIGSLTNINTLPYFHLDYTQQQFAQRQYCNSCNINNQYCSPHRTLDIASFIALIRKPFRQQMRRTFREQGDDADSSLFETKIRILHGVILSNEQLIHAQTQQISALKKSLQMERERNEQANQMKTNNYDSITTANNKDIHNSIITQKESLIDSTKPCAQCSFRIRQLEQELVSTKLKLAEQFSNSLEQHITIQSLHKEHLMLSEQLEMFSNKSEQEEIGQDHHNGQSPSNNSTMQQEATAELINKTNIGLWIANINDEKHQGSQLNTHNEHSAQLHNIHTLNYLSKSQSNQLIRQNYKFSQSQQINKLFKLWSKHIQKQRKRFRKHHSLSTSLQSTFHSIFYPKNSIDKDAFSKATFPLLIKYHGVPLQLRNVVWPFLINDKLSLTQSLYSKLSQKSFQQSGTDPSVKEQIRKDMVRSFNGECSISNLFKIYNKTHQLININSSSMSITSSPIQLKRQQSIQKQQQNLQGIQKGQQIQQNKQTTQKDVTLQQQDQIVGQITLVRKQTIETSETEAMQGTVMVEISEDLNTLSLKQKSISTNNINITSQSIRQVFPIHQLATKTLQIFSLYRPDIGFIQGMTYPTIILTLVLKQQDVFRVLANVLLTREFFLKMITVQEGFVDIICRVFEEMLYERDIRLHERLVRQLAVRSEVYVVDWFWTFYSRNLSPTVILKIWDLIIYHYSIGSAHPELILFEMALIILELLSPILYQTNYQETIRTIREYWRKIDENEMIEKLYEGMGQWEDLQKVYRRGFEKMGKKIRDKKN